MKLFVTALFLLPLFSTLEAQTVQNFESFGDSTVLTNQIAGLTFTNATVVTAGITLNDAQYPPRSGVNVATNAGGSSITITFATPIPSVVGYYTYSGQLTVQAFNASSALVATSTSRFSNNTILNGAGGSSPNEPISVTSAGGIASITITTTAAANSFTLDDLTYGALSVPTLTFPATAGLAVLLMVLACLALGRQTRAAGIAAVLLLTFTSTPMRAAIFVVSIQPPNPQNIPTNAPTQVTFSCTVQSGQGAVGNVNLLRTDTTPPTNLGPMTGGPTNYSLTVTITATSNNQDIPFQCSVGVGLSTIRAKSGFTYMNQAT